MGAKAGESMSSYFTHPASNAHSNAAVLAKWTLWSRHRCVGAVTTGTSGGP